MFTEMICTVNIMVLLNGPLMEFLKSYKEVKDKKWKNKGSTRGVEKPKMSRRSQKIRLSGKTQHVVLYERIYLWKLIRFKEIKSFKTSCIYWSSISRNCDVKWAPRLYDLTLLDHFFRDIWKVKYIKTISSQFFK